jgi:geranylgeranyl diphosphate synthase type II
LNLAGELSKYGKEIGGDLWEGKRTLVIIDLLRKCSPKEREYVIEILNKDRDKKNKADIGQILKLIDEHDCIEYAAGISQGLARRARGLFVETIDHSIDPTYRQIVIDLIDFMVNREL